MGYFDDFSSDIWDAFGESVLLEDDNASSDDDLTLDTGDDTNTQSNDDTSDQQADDNNQDNTADNNQDNADDKNKDDNNQEDNTNDQNKDDNNDQGDNNDDNQGDDLSLDTDDNNDGESDSGDGSDNMGSDDDSMGDTTDSTNDPNSKLKDLEKSIFDQLSDDQKALKTKELKSLFNVVYDKCTEIISTISNADRNPEQAKIYDYVMNSLTDLQKYIKDYLFQIFDSKTYIENMYQLQKYLVVLDTVSNIFEELKNSSDTQKKDN